MKIDRLIGILSILLQQEKVTAPELAERFEVSRRTINRDIEEICMAGIPLVTTQGKNGGISIMEGYRMDKTLLTSSDMQAILSGLRSLDSVSGTNRYQQLMDKLSYGSSSVITSNNHILIDLSSWHKTSLPPKITLIQDAIEQRKVITFSYYARTGETLRNVESYYLIFQWADWYMWGYCRKRQDFRMFKLSRVQELHLLEETYERREVAPPEFSEHIWRTHALAVEVALSASMKWRLVEEFGMESFEEQIDGSLVLRYEFPDREQLFRWLLSLGDKAELRAPEAVREEYHEYLKKIIVKYEKESLK